MTETLEYIEAYFTNALDENGKKSFEKRCGTDDVFAQEVALYTLTRQALRDELLMQKQAQWKAMDIAKETKPVPVRKMHFMKWVPYAAAACILLAVLFTFLNGNPSPQQLADNYIDKNMVLISQTMDATTDSLHTGIAYYNSKKYDAALNIFKALDNDLPVKNTDAKKYEGYVYLVIKDYNKALVQFDELSKMDLFSNPGNFLKAVTLIKRNAAGDKEEAKLLLQKVIADKQEGSEDAVKMLKELN